VIYFHLQREKLDKIGRMTVARILIVDDERTIADTLSTIFRKVGYEAFTAYNGLLGLDAARNLVPNIVLSDVLMPGLDGVTMAMEIRSTLPDVQILLFSGQAATVELLHDAEEKGFHFEIMQKPIHPDEIIRKVASALARIDKLHNNPDFHN
jgi:DNA-binding NtrC family response regulator